MTPLRLLLLAGLVLPVQVSWAQEASKPSSDATDEKRREIVETLDSFLAAAEREGVLVPPGGAEPDPAPATKGKAPEAAAPGPAPAMAEPKPVTAVRNCGRGDALDFSALVGISRYGDLEQYQAAARNRDGTSDPDAVQMLVKAYIALGLYSEALVLVDRAHDPDFAIYGTLILFLRDGGGKAESLRLTLEECGVTGLWSGMARIASGDTGGSPLISQAMPDYRQLPHLMRVRLAFLIVPDLVRLGETQLAERLMASFTPEEVAASDRLQFLGALLRLEGGDAAAQREIRTSLSTPGLGEVALEALLRADAPISEAERAVILTDEVARLKGGRGMGDVTSAGFDFVVGELIAEREYGQIISLVEQAETRNEAEREQIRIAMARQLRDDLASEDPMRSAGVLSVLADNPLGLKTQATQDLYEEASVRAFRMGLSSFGADLASGYEVSEDTEEARAALAYSRGDAATVYAGADRFSGNQTLSLLAALSAIGEGRADRLAKYEARLAPTPAVLSALLGRDAVTGRWMVAQRFYEAAEQLADADLTTEITLALILREPERKPRPAPRIGEVGNALADAREAMARVTGKGSL